MKMKMYKVFAIFGLMGLVACNSLKVVNKPVNVLLPQKYANATDTVNSAQLKWRDFFSDQQLISFIDTALQNNQELNILMQELQIANNEVKARKGAFLPFFSVGAASSIDKVGRYTSQGASDANNEIMPGKAMPDPLSNMGLGVNMTWEIDIWKKLRNAKKSAIFNYLSSVEGKNFMVTHLIAEISDSYFELLSLDNQLEIVKANIEIYKNSLEIVKLEKNAARTTELAVRRFEAEVLKNLSRQYAINQQIVETENRINLLLGRFPQPVKRNSKVFFDLKIDSIYSGIPSQLLLNRTDIKQAEYHLLASKIDVQVARAEFFPSLRLTSGIGFNAFNAKYLLQLPQSIFYHIGGDLLSPLINKNAIKANFFNANSKQIQAVYNYEKSILNAFLEVQNQQANLSNLKMSYALKNKQVETLTQSIEIANTLFKSARADYMEVLLTQRDALESRIELIETKKQQLKAMVNLYQALGGGWR